MARITLNSSVGSFEAYAAAPAGTGPFPAIIVIEEIWGVDEHIEDVTERFAKEGFLALAPEILDESVFEKTRELGAQMTTPEKRQELQPQLRAAMQPLREPEYAVRAVQKLMAAADHLLGDDRANGKVGSVGFCFGGTYSLQFALTDPRCDACVVFYGHAPEPLDSIATIACPVLGLYGEKDEPVTSKLPQLEAAMREHDVDFTYTVYPNAAHAFFNDRGPRYNAAAAEDAWIKTLTFLRATLSA